MHCCIFVVVSLLLAIYIVKCGSQAASSIQVPIFFFIIFFMVIILHTTLSSLSKISSGCCKRYKELNKEEGGREESRYLLPFFSLNR